MRQVLIFIGACVLATAPARAAQDDVWHVEAPQALGLLERVEALREAELTRILDQALASIGCAIPADLVAVFDIYLVDQVLTHLEYSVGPELAQQGFLALMLGQAVPEHPEGDAIVAAARVMQGRVSQRMRDGEWTQAQGVFRVDGCVQTGTVFNLAPYAAP